MKKIFILSLGFLLTLGGGFYLTTKFQQNEAINDDVIVHEEDEKKVIYGKTEAFAFKDAIKNADLIAEIEITKHVEDLNEPSPKTLFEGELIKAFKNKKAPDKIKILQAGNQEYSYNEFSLFKPGEKYILFLKEAVGDGFDGTDTYWILGEETNIYSVLENNSVKKWSLKDENLSDIEIKDNNVRLKNENGNEQVLDKKLFEEKMKKIVIEGGN